MKEIVLAGGCFWGVEAYFQKLKGIVNTKVGYAQGFDENPIYNNVKKELTGHAEVCLIEYQETIIPLTKILEHYFKIINPTSINKQGEDEGSQYRTGIYYIEEQDYLVIAGFIKNEQQNYRDKIAIEVEKLSKFYDAEEYHQNYLMKNPTGYCHINLNKINKEDLK